MGLKKCEIRSCRDVIVFWVVAVR